MLNQVFNEDCLEGMKRIPDKSVDMILCDLPYGTTACKWDTVIPFELLWEQYERIIKDNGAIVLTAAQPFTTELIKSNQKLFKYCWYWIKTKPTGFQHAKNRPLNKVEEVIVFSKGYMGHASLLKNRRLAYNPQGLVRINKTVKGAKGKFGGTVGNRPSHVDEYVAEFTNYPTNVLEFASQHGVKHPTAKPVDLFEYLIKTYTNEGDVVLDNCMGSGTTAIACLNTGRNYIGFELDRDYYEKLTERIASHKLKGTEVVD